MATKTMLAKTTAQRSRSRSSATLNDAWAVDRQTQTAWTARPWVQPSTRSNEGRLARKRVPRSTQAAFVRQPGCDPIAILLRQEADRLPDLLPLRHARMAESPFAYYRGTPAVMAFDLATTPRTGILVQASGDAHVANFGLFASPERRLVFDANDFDETMAGPWEWDVKRLATSVVIAGRANGFNAAQNRGATMAAVRSYREWMARYAQMSLIDVWYSYITDQAIAEAAQAAFGGSKSSGRRLRIMKKLFSKARGHDQMRAANQLTAVVGGRRTVVLDPPIIQRVKMPGGPGAMRKVFEDYRSTMPQSRRQFLERYRFVDFALKVVGVGSVGTRCYIMALEGRDQSDSLILQGKEASASVLEEHLGDAGYANHGQRVVVGQRLMQATPDIFLGWTRGPNGRDFYVRQLWDMKGGVDTSALARPEGLGFYGGLCAWALARAHARSGDSVAVSAYLGTSDTVDGAIADFAETYADQNETDHRLYVAALRADEAKAAGSASTDA